MTIVEMQMNIDCDGCEDNVRKALQRLQGVDYVDVDRVRGKVTVTGSASQKKVLRAARRSGRLAVLWPSAYDTDHRHHHQAYYAAQAAHPAYHHLHSIKPVAIAVAARAQHHHHYSSVQHGRMSGGGKATSSYNYHVHGYFDSDLHGYSSGHHDHHGDVVPAAARSYFSDENPHACAVM
uniref:HMA domain-containing protein n=1 Tax=Oryza punctata TaxID=4537 RepID=A0A0E0LCD9_ORYPU